MPYQIDYLPGNLLIDSCTIITSDETFTTATKVAEDALNLALMSRVGNDSDTSGK